MNIIDVEKFAATHGRGVLYQDWPRATLDAHLCDHASKGTLLVAADENELRGFATYRRIKNWNGDVIPHFWKPDDADGETIYIHEICATSPEAMVTVLDRFKEISPDFDQLQYVAHRRGNLRRYNYFQLQRIATRIAQHE